MKKSALLLIIPALLAINACTADIGTNDYYASSAGEVNRAAKGVILSVRQVTVKSNDNNAGTLIGAAAGGVAGSTIGGGDTAHILGAIGGAVVGGIAGDAAQGQLSKQAAYEYVIQLDNGGLATVVQGANELLTPGQRCIVLYGRQARVIPYNGI